MLQGLLLPELLPLKNSIVECRQPHEAVLPLGEKLSLEVDISLRGESMHDKLGEGCSLHKPLENWHGFLVLRPDLCFLCWVLVEGVDVLREHFAVNALRVPFQTTLFIPSIWSHFLCRGRWPMLSVWLNTRWSVISLSPGSDHFKGAAVFSSWWKCLARLNVGCLIYCVVVLESFDLFKLLILVLASRIPQVIASFHLTPIAALIRREVDIVQCCFLKDLDIPGLSRLPAPWVIVNWRWPTWDGWWLEARRQEGLPGWLLSGTTRDPPFDATLVYHMWLQGSEVLAHLLDKDRVKDLGGHLDLLCLQIEGLPLQEALSVNSPKVEQLAYLAGGRHFLKSIHHF